VHGSLAGNPDGDPGFGSDLNPKWAKINDLRLPFFSRWSRQNEKGVKNLPHPSEFRLDGPGVVRDLFVFRVVPDLGDTHPEQFEIEHRDVERSLQVVGSVAAPPEVRRRKSFEPGFHGVLLAVQA
jgi:hypothetical protein